MAEQFVDTWQSLPDSTGVQVHQHERFYSVRSETEPRYYSNGKKSDVVAFVGVAVSLGLVWRPA
jgi:hypothetical protein